ncbi:Uncharacterized protein C7orf10 [Anas platyrhynchos]|uniref:Uncharacterized protein C7orf10 n=1 Tax=Anas platyrhynchos TaxID=8839 RepID=R0LSQ4_ANAPL|nr:Uncharacterized protein C7orf10 [Anas platyrhynchos]
MELVKKSADLEKKKRFGEILRKLDCVLVSEMLIAVEESLLVVLSMEYHWTLQIGGPGVRYSEFAVSHPKPPPLVGQHTVEILKGMLGYEDNAIEELLHTGAVAQHECPLKHVENILENQVIMAFKQQCDGKEVLRELLAQTCCCSLRQVTGHVAARGVWRGLVGDTGPSMMGSLLLCDLSQRLPSQVAFNDRYSSGN